MLRIREESRNVESHDRELEKISKNTNQEDKKETDKSKIDHTGNLKDIELVMRNTKGCGDCAFHAALGIWNPTDKWFEATDIREKREIVAKAIRDCQGDCQADSALFTLVKAAITELVMSNDRDIKGEEFKKYKKKYESYKSEVDKVHKSKWILFKEELTKHPSVVYDIYQFTKEYIKSKNLPVENIHRLRSNFFQAFKNFWVNDEKRLRSLIAPFLDLDKAYIAYITPNKNWESDQYIGYDLALMSDLPENDKTKAENGIIYLSEDGNYVVRDPKGVLQESSLNAQANNIDLSQLREKLQDPNLKSAVLAVTSKAGHTQYINSFLLTEYADFFEKTGQYLLPCELNIIAHVFKISITFYATKNANPESFNPGQEKKVSVSFNGRDHYERMASEQEINQYQKANSMKAQAAEKEKQKIKSGSGLYDRGQAPSLAVSPKDNKRKVEEEVTKVPHSKKNKMKKSQEDFQSGQHLEDHRKGQNATYEQLSKALNEYPPGSLKPTFFPVSPPFNAFQFTLPVLENSKNARTKPSIDVNNCVDLLDLPHPLDMHRKSSKFYQPAFKVNEGTYDGTLQLDSTGKTIFRQGVGTYTADNGEIYSGEWHKDHYHGYGCYQKKDASTHYGVFRNGRMHEGFGTVFHTEKGIHSIYEGKLLDEKYHGTGTLSLTMSDNREQRFRLVAEWAGGKATTVYLNEIDAEHTLHFTSFFSELEKAFLDFSDLARQAKRLNHGIQLLQQTSGESLLLEEISKSFEFEPHLKNHANKLFNVYRLYDYLTNNFGIGLTSLLNCRKQFTEHCSRGIKYYRDNLLYDTYSEIEYKNFKDIQQSICQSVDKLFLEKATDTLEHNLVTQARLLRFEPLGIEFIRKLGMVLYQCQLKLSSSRRRDDKKVLDDVCNYIIWLWKDYENQVQVEKNIPPLNRQDMDLFMAVFEECMAFEFLRVFSQWKKLGQEIGRIWLSYLDGEKVKYHLWAPEVNTVFRLNQLCRSLLLTAKKHKKIKAYEEIFQLIIKSYNKDTNETNNTSMAYLEELRNVIAIIEYFLTLELTESTIKEQQLNAISALFGTEKNHFSRMYFSDLINSYRDYNEKIKFKNRVLPNVVNDVVRNILEFYIDSLLVKAINEIFCRLSKEKPLDAIPISRLVDFITGISALELRWYLNEKVVKGIEKGEYHFKDSRCWYYSELGSADHTCNTKGTAQQLSKDSVLYELLTLEKGARREQFKFSSPPHYILDTLLDLLKLVQKKKIIRSGDKSSQGDARIALLDAITESLTYFPSHTKYNDLDQFRKDRVAYFRQAVEAQSSMEEFKLSLAKIAVNATFNANTKSMTLEKAIELFKIENKNENKKQSKQLTRLKKQYEKYDKEFKDCLEQIQSYSHPEEGQPAKELLIEEFVKSLKKSLKNLSVVLPGDGYDLLLMSKSDFEKKLQTNSNPILINMRNGNYKLWGNKDGKGTWEETELQNFTFPNAWKAKQSIFVSPADAAIWNTLKKGHTPSNNKENIPSILAKLSVILALSASGHLEKNENSCYRLSPQASKTPFIFPYTIQILGVLRLLSADTSGDQLENHLIQILTGQGKSWTLALLASFFALLGYRVTVACYSKELTVRDEKDFRNNFAALNFQEGLISYKTFDQLMEEKLTLGGMDIFDRCTNIITSTVDITTNKHGNKNSDKEILLIDEVDVFFTDKFGDKRDYVITPWIAAIAAIQKEIWDQLNKNANTNKKSLEENCRIALSNAAMGIGRPKDPILCYFEKNGLMELLGSHLNNMIETAIEIYKCYKEKKEPTYTYRFNQTKEYIEIKSPSGMFDDNLLPGTGYYNAFYYLLEKYKRHQEFKGDLSEKQYGYLVLNIGSISYAELPKTYKGIFGATGTLRDLLAGERDALLEYNINKLSYCPSFFGSSNLNKDFLDKDKDKEPGCLLAKDETQWFDQIAVSAKANISDKEKARSVLIFFETEEQLKKFQTNHTGDLGQAPYFLTENQRYNGIPLETLIGKDYAGKQGKITLLTKIFGRGIDFKPSAAVNQQGGMHVIQTFFSMDIKEEIQIKGRTARKDYPGSYEQIFCLTHLQDNGLLLNPKIHIDNTVRYLKNDKVYTTLLEERKTKSETKVRFLLEKNKAYTELHQQSMDFFKEAAACDENKRPAFIEKLFKRHTENVTRRYSFFGAAAASLQTGSILSRTICLMDATGSMSSLLENAKKTVTTMFERAHEILKKQGVDPKSAFELQFAVYRNYSSGEKLLEHSDWQKNPNDLLEFMDRVGASGGNGNEAIEAGLWYAMREHGLNPISQIILIGDMPPNTQKEFSVRKKNSHDRYKEVRYYEEELARITNACIPIHAFYLKKYAKSTFHHIAASTNGQCQLLDIYSDRGAEDLTDLVTRRILQNVGNNLAPGKGEELVQAYNQAYRKSSNA